MKNGIDCPVDFIPVNENKVRLVALLVLLLGLVFISTGYWVIVAFLVVDFFLRSVNLGKYSLLGVLSAGIISLLCIKTKPVDQAPKRFAARMGLTFTIVILAMYLLQLEGIALALGVILCLFAFLESILAFCAGCYVYSFWYSLFPKQ
jgi:hypothetical protein